MKLNFRKTIVDQIDEALAAAKRPAESIELDRAERAEMYRVGVAAGRFVKLRRLAAGRPALRGEFLTAAGRWIEVFAAEDL